MLDEQSGIRSEFVLDRVTRLALIGSGVVISTAYSALIPVLPVIEDHFRSDPNADLLTKFLVMAIGLAMVIVSPWTSLLARLVGHGRLLAIATLVYAIAGSAGGVLNDIALLAASRMIVGACAAVISVLVVSTIVSIGDSSLRARMLGQWVACSSLGLVLVLPVVGFLGDMSWRAAFLVHLIAIPFALGFARLQGRTSHHGEREDSHLREPLANRKAYYFGGFAFIIGCINLGTPLFFPYLLRDMELYSPSFASRLFVISVLAAALAALNFGRLSASASLRQLFGLGLCVMSLGWVLLVLSRDTTFLVFAQVISGMGGGIVLPAVSLGAGAIALRGQEAKVVGLAKGAYSMGAFAGPAFLQPVAASAGTTWVFVVAASVAALASLGALPLFGAGTANRPDHAEEDGR